MSREFVLRNKRKDELVQIILDLETEIAEKEPSEGSSINDEDVCKILRQKNKELKQELSQAIENSTEWASRCRKAWDAIESLKNEYLMFKEQMLKTRQNARANPRGEK